MEPDRTLGAETVSDEDMTTVNVCDQPETVEVWVAQRAFAFTEYVPADVQLFEADVCPTGSHPESVPSFQSKRY